MKNPPHRAWLVCLGGALAMFAVMGLGVKTGETITFTIEGGDEEASAAAMEQFFKDNL